jgi:hypothetical protein
VQLLLDHGPDVHRRHAAQIVHALTTSMDQRVNPSPRIRTHAAGALINFVDFCDAAELAPYVGAILAAALGVLSAGPRIAQEQAVAVLSSAAMQLEAALGAAHYAELMPLLQSGLAQCPPTDEYRTLKGRLLECITLIGVAVPKEQFARDVMPLMTAMVAATQANTAASASADAAGGGGGGDDPQRAFLLKAWIRIAKALGPDFVPYLDVVMAPLLQSLERSVESELTEEQMASEEAEDDSDTECVVQNADGKFMQVRSSALEEQASAAHLLCLLSEAMGRDFAPYVPRCAAAMAPLAATSVHDDVRTYCLATLPELVAAVAMEQAALLDPAQRWPPVQALLRFILPRALEAVENEGELELLLTAMQALKACLENGCRANWAVALKDEDGGGVARKAPLTPATSQPLLATEELAGISAVLQKALKESIQRRAVARAEAQLDEDYDEDEAERDANRGAEEEDLQYNITEVGGE